MQGLPAAPRSKEKDKMDKSRFPHTNGNGKLPVMFAAKDCDLLGTASESSTVGRTSVRMNVAGTVFYKGMPTN